MKKFAIFSVLIVLLSSNSLAQEIKDLPHPESKIIEEALEVAEAAVDVTEYDAFDATEWVLDDFKNWPTEDTVQEAYIAASDLPKATPNSMVLGFQGVRALKEVNTTDDGEAYPWISNDGLRLYYNGKGSNILFASRPNTNEPFQEKKELFSEFSMDLISVWLNDDETEIYFTSREYDDGRTTTIYTSKRADMLDEFPNPTKVTILGDVSGFLSAPSLTPDGETLFLYNASGWKTLVMKKEGEHTFRLSHILPLPEGYTAGPGQLSLNGLHYYLSIEDHEHNSKGIYVYKRSMVSEPFTELYYLDNQEINRGQRNHQPGVSNNGKYMAFTRSLKNYWEENDLFIAHNPMVDAPIINYDVATPRHTVKPKDIIAAVFPNPTRDFINFKIIKSGYQLGTVSLKIYAMDGRMVENLDFETDKTMSLSTKNYTAGMYSYTIYKSTKVIKNGRFVVQ